MTFGRYAAVLLSGLLILAPTFATADQGIDDIDDDVEEVSSDDLDRAQQRFDEGAELYYQGNYARAAVEFRRAHEIHPHPLFLYNFALASLQLERLDDALDAARRAEAMDEPLPERQAARNSAIIHGAATVVASHDKVEALAETTVEPPPETDDAGFGPLGWAGIGTLVAGTGGLVGGIVTHFNTQTFREEERYDERLEANPNSSGVRQLTEEIERREMSRNILGGAGIGLMLAGTGLIIWDSRTGAADDATAVRLHLAPTGPGVTVAW